MISLIDGKETKEKLLNYNIVLTRKEEGSCAGKLSKKGQLYGKRWKLDFLVMSVR